MDFCTEQGSGLDLSDGFITNSVKIAVIRYIHLHGSKIHEVQIDLLRGSAQASAAQILRAVSEKEGCLLPGKCVHRKKPDCAPYFFPSPIPTGRDKHAHKKIQSLPPKPINLNAETIPKLNFKKTTDCHLG